MSPQRRERIEDRARAILISMALQELRQTRHLTQQELADILTVQNVSRVCLTDEEL